MSAISVRDLVVEYRRPSGPPLRAVDDVSFTVHEGEIVGFLGVNGAGKTSTIKTLMGFQEPTSGLAEIFGRPVGEAAARGQVGFLPETALYSPFLTPAETLWVHGELHGLSGAPLKARVAELLEIVGIGQKARALNRTLSKGMLQRVGIAQALLSAPRLLVLDEVASGLDPIGRRDLRELLRRQNELGTTIFFSSHQLGEVELICDRVLVLNKGRLVAEREVAELKGRVPSLESYFVELVETGRDPLSAPETSAARELAGIGGAR